MNKIKIENLQEEILNAQAGYTTDSYSMSIGEFMSMYKSGELDINPKYQREFRWSEEQQSIFIESVFLGIPLPSIFIFHDKKKWEVIDGLQRLSTIFHFTGIAQKESDSNTDSHKKGLDKIKGVKTLKLLNGLTWEDIDEDLQFEFKKTKMDIKIIKASKNNSTVKTKAKFELFQRLNQKPTILSGQEYRNALLIMNDENIYNWLENLAKYGNFVNCIEGLDEKWVRQQYDKELVLRLFIFPLYKLKSTIKKVDDYMDDSIFFRDEDSLLEKISKGEFNLEEEQKKFQTVFDLLYEAKGKDVFKRDKRGQQFLESYFEIVAIGLYSNIKHYANTEEDIALIKYKIDAIEEQEEVKSFKGTGSNTEIRIRKLVPFGNKYFKK